MNLQYLNLVEFNIREEEQEQQEELEEQAQKVVEVTKKLLPKNLQRIITALIYNWSEIKRGFSDGWNSI